MLLNVLIRFRRCLIWNEWTAIYRIPFKRSGSGKNEDCGEDDIDRISVFVFSSFTLMPLSESGPLGSTCSPGEERMAVMHAAISGLLGSLSECLQQRFSV